MEYLLLLLLLRLLALYSPAALTVEQNERNSKRCRVEMNGYIECPRQVLCMPLSNTSLCPLS